MQLNPLKILLIEDNPEDAFIIDKHLEENNKFDINAVLAISLDEAFTELERETFDIILSDLNLPDSRGIDTLKELYGKVTDIPIIVLTGLDYEDMGITAVHLGAEDYLIKDQIETHMLIKTILYAIERNRLKKELRKISMFDDLTNLYNRRAFMALAQQQLKRARRLNKELTLFFIDLDKMKNINDQLGHLHGDMALQDAAALLRKTFREMDIISRLGGDEFVVLAENVDGNQVEGIEHRLKEQLDNYNRQNEHGFKLSFSIGEKNFNPNEDNSIERILNEADEKMYKRKRREWGGN